MTITYSNAISVGIQASSTWVPLPGNVAAVSLNTPNAVNPYPSVAPFPSAAPGTYSTSGQFAGQERVFTAWNGGVFAPSLGALGSLVYWGGGHQDYGGNEVYRYDFSSRLHTRLTNPHNYVSGSGGASNGTYPWDATWGDFNDDQTPIPNHNYGCQVGLSGAQAGNTTGALIIPSLGGAGVGAIQIRRAHKLNLDSNAWSRYGTGDSPATTNGTSGSACYDSSRNCIWMVTGSQFTVGKLDLGSLAWTYYTTNSVFWIWGCTAIYDSVADLILVLKPTTADDASPQVLALIDPADPTTAKLATVTGTPPVNSGCGFGRCTITDKFYCFPGSGGNTLITLARPTSGGNWNGTWTFGTEAFTGSAPAAQNRVYGKFGYAPSLKCFYAYGNVSGGIASGSVYLYRPTGT